MSSREELLAEGWRTVGIGGFTAFVGPVWLRDEDDAPRFGLLVEDQHLNVNKVLHGGMTGFFADVAMGQTIIAKLGGQAAATIQLGVHFVAAARLGEFIEAEVELIRVTGTVAFVRGVLSVQGKILATADGVWKILEKPAIT